METCEARAMLTPLFVREKRVIMSRRAVSKPLYARFGRTMSSFATTLLAKSHGDISIVPYEWPSWLSLLKCLHFAEGIGNTCWL